MSDPIAEQVRSILEGAIGSLGDSAPPHLKERLAEPPPPPPPESQQKPPPPTTRTTRTNGLPLWVHPGINSATFDLNAYLASIPNLKALLASPQGRKALTYADPILFALTYLSKHLKDPNRPTAPPSFADCHFDWARSSLRWAAQRNQSANAPPPEPAEDRIAEIAPRMCGKSTWWFLILPMWAAAHGHKRFVAAFASTATQAQKHLNTFKNELDTNRYIREDYPDLCSPKRRLRGSVVADRVDEFQSDANFVFAAKGVDSSNLGMKVEEHRPDLILLDDVEPDESSYNAELAQKRLQTITDAILQLNIYASVVFVGTVTMPNSIIHQLVKHARGQQAYDWIMDEKIAPHYYSPIQYNAATRAPRSLWPEKWSLEYLRSIQHTRSYAKNYANDPKGRDGDYWNEEDFTRATPNETALSKTRTGIFIDPPTTSSKTSDPAGIAIISHTPPTKHDVDTYRKYEMSVPVTTAAGNRLRHKATNKTYAGHPGHVCVHYADEVRLTGKALAKHVYSLIESRPELNIRRIIVESTQGGDLWLEVFENSPLKVEVVNPREGKPQRFDRALEYYQKQPTLVTHDIKANLSKLEEQQMGFPKHAYDDIADAAVTGILYFLEPRPRKIRTKTKAVPYV